MPGYDPRTTTEFQEIEVFVTDNLDFTRRKWSIIIGGRNLDEIIIANFAKLCFLNQGEIKTHIFYKQITQIESGKKQMLKPIPKSLLKLALIKMVEMTKRAQIEQHSQQNLPVTETVPVMTKNNNTEEVSQNV